MRTRALPWIARVCVKSLCTSVVSPELWYWAEERRAGTAGLDAECYTFFSVVLC